jgi:hypothetical protein
MNMGQDTTFIIFAVISLIFGVIGFVRGNLTVGLGEGDGFNSAVSGGIARAISAFLIISSIFLFSGNKVGYVILGVSVLVAAIVSRR